MAADRDRGTRLSAVDTAWLRMEEPTNLMMVTAVSTFDKPLDFERLKATLECRMLRFKRFRQRVVEPKVPWGSPRWKLDPTFDPSHALDLAKLGANSARALGKLVLIPPDKKTVFKGKLGVSKRAAWSKPLPLYDIKQIGCVTGGTINDILLTAVAGALRRYMLSRGQPADGINIRAVVPVNLRPLDIVPDLGNRFGLVFLSLPVGIADPLERLFELKRRMDAIKGSPEATVAFGILAAIGMTPIDIERIIVSIFGMKATGVMTNVPGPRQTLYMAGQPIREILFWVPSAGHLGLGVSIMSYAGAVTLGITTDSGLVPDPAPIISGFYQEIDEFTELVRQAQALDDSGTGDGRAAEVATASPEPVQEVRGTGRAIAIALEREPVAEAPGAVSAVAVAPAGAPVRCRATTKAGTPCKNWLLPGAAFCRVHSKEEASSRGPEAAV